MAGGLLQPLQQSQLSAQQQPSQLSAGAFRALQQPIQAPGAFESLIAGAGQGLALSGEVQRQRQIEEKSRRDEEQRQAKASIERSKLRQSRKATSVKFLDKATSLLEGAAVSGGLDGLNRMAKSLSDTGLTSGIQPVIDDLAEGNFTIEQKGKKYKLIPGVDGKFIFEDISPGLATENQDTFRKIRDTILKDKGYESARGAHSAASGARSLLDVGNPISANALKVVLPRLLGEVGNLSRSEQQSFGGSPAVVAFLNQSFETLKTGRLTKDNEAFLRQIIDTLDNNAIKRGADRINQFVDSEVAIGTDRALLEKFISPFSFDGTREVATTSVSPNAPQIVPGTNTPLFNSMDDAQRALDSGQLQNVQSFQIGNETFRLKGTQ